MNIVDDTNDIFFYKQPMQNHAFLRPLFSNFYYFFVGKYTTKKYQNSCEEILRKAFKLFLFVNALYV